MENNLDHFLTKIDWKSEKRAKKIDSSHHFYCNLRFKDFESLWSVIIHPYTDTSRDSTNLFVVSLLLSDNCGIMVYKDMEFHILEGPVNIIGEGSIIE